MKYQQSQGEMLTEPKGWGDSDATKEGDVSRPLDIRALWSVFWRRKWILIVCIALGAGLAHLYAKQQVSIYTASAEVLLTGREENVVNLRAVVEDLNGFDRALSTNEVRIITSQRLIERTIERLRLDRDTEFAGNPNARPGFLARWRQDLLAMIKEGPLGELLSGPPVTLEPVVDEAGQADAKRRAIVAHFRSKLSVRPIIGTRSVTISFTSTNPAKAALIANTLADLYIVDQLETKFEATRRASAWLNERIGDLKRTLEESEAAVEAFKADQALGAGQGVEVTQQQIASLNAELISARAALAEAEARFNQVQSRANSGGLSAASNVVDSALILTLRTNLSELRRREAELSQTYGERHPNMINVRAEIQDARNAIASEVRKIIEGLRNDVAVARARERTLDNSVSDLENRSINLSRTSVQLRQLEREAEADRLIYENFLNRFRETSEQEDLQTADARILSEATPPFGPSAPNRRKMLAFGIAGGGALGLGLILLLEMLVNTYRTASEVTARTGLPVLSSLPQSGRRQRRRKVLDYVRDKPNSALAEAVRSLRTSLFLTNIDKPPRVVMVTSSVPQEGKSTTALLLAHMSTQMNKSAIVVDCDIRRPTLHQTFGIEKGSGGLLSVLDGTVPLQEAIAIDEESGLHVLPTTESIPQAADVLSSERFRNLIETLRNHYELVVLDTPPILLVSDAGAIGKLSDASIYAVRWNHTPREAAMQGIDALKELGIRIAGCVVTLVDRREEARYAYAYYGYGYGYYAGKDTYYVN